MGRRSGPRPRRTAIASVGLWLAVPVLAAGLVGSAVLRSGARSYVACWLLLVAWFVLARTKTLRWSSVARLFVAGVPVAVLAAFVTEALASLADLDVAESGAAIGIAGTVEELAKLTPLAVLCLVAPGRVRRFSLVDWALVGVASGLAFQATEDAVRRISWSVTDRLLTGGADPWADPLSGFPHYRWSLLSGSADSGGHAVFPGHHVTTGLVALAIGVAVQSRGTSWRRFVVWSLPVLAAVVAVAAHMGFTATMANRILFEAGDSEVPRPLFLVWKLTDRGRLVGPLLLVAFLGCLMADAARLRRAEPLLPPHPGGPPPAVPGRWTRVGRALRLHESDPGPAVFAVTADAAASIGRDLVAIGRSLRRSDGAEPAPDRWAATVEIERRRRAVVQDEPDAAAQRQVRIVAVVSTAVATVALLWLGVATASGIGRFLAGPGSPSLAGLLDGFSIWWASLGVPGQLAAVLGTVALVSFSAGDFGLLLRPPAARIVGLSPHRAARSGIELLAARVLPPRESGGEVDLVAALLGDPEGFARRYQRRPLAPPSRRGVERIGSRLAGRGVTVERGTASRRAGQAPVTPDLVMDGHRFDVVSPRTGDARQIAVVIEVRVVRGDATRFVLDLDESPVDLQVLRRQLDRFPIPGLETVVVVRGDQALRFFP